MAKEDFCKHLDEQIKDERNAYKAYTQLLDKGEEILSPSTRNIIKQIRFDEERHEADLEHLKKTVCEVK